MPKMDRSWVAEIGLGYTPFSPIKHDSARTMINKFNSLDKNNKGTYAKQQFNRIIADVVKDTHHLIPQVQGQYKRIDAMLIPKGDMSSRVVLFEHTALLAQGKLVRDGEAMFGLDVEASKVIVCGNDRSTKGDRRWAKENNVYVINMGCNSGQKATEENIESVARQIRNLAALVDVLANERYMGLVA